MVFNQFQFESVFTVFQDDPLKGSMHSFLLSSTNQQEIAGLDNKVHCDPLYPACINIDVNCIN